MFFQPAWFFFPPPFFLLNYVLIWLLWCSLLLSSSSWKLWAAATRDTVTSELILECKSMEEWSSNPTWSVGVLRTVKSYSLTNHRRTSVLVTLRSEPGMERPNSWDPFRSFSFATRLWQLSWTTVICPFVVWCGHLAAKLPPLMKCYHSQHTYLK